jgi:hypothetical protein
MDCRIECRRLVPADQPLGCLAARGDPPDEELDDAQLRAEVRDILGNARLTRPRRRSIDRQLKALPAIDWDARSVYENADPTDH